ncbi:hypothetical protein MWQ64_002435 [Staphylococcus pseudintermedius]|nr:hypothetical protein [Staphylococcus pseudintermedius]EJA1886733.1 hypothetical protein [Staphylococcus pseudintermedius]
MTITIDKMPLDEKGVVKTTSIGIIIFEEINLGIDEVLDLFDKAKLIERLPFGFCLIIDNYKYNIRDLYNRTTRKNESPKDYVRRVWEAPNAII